MNIDFSSISSSWNYILAGYRLYPGIDDHHRCRWFVPWHVISVVSHL